LCEDHIGSDLPQKFFIDLVEALPGPEPLGHRTVNLSLSQMLDWYGTANDNRPILDFRRIIALMCDAHQTVIKTKRTSHFGS
jgi:hypothetical protein